MQQMSDEELMLEYQKGQAKAMDELLLRYKNPVYRFAFRLCNNQEEAQDIAQEVFLRVHQFRGNYRPSGKFSTWIFSIAHNFFLSCLRKKKWQVFWPRQKEDPQEPVDFPGPDPSPREAAVGNEVAELVSRSIQGLPFLQKEALILREYEKFDYQQIAEILHKPHGTIKTLIHRARENLKNKLLPYIEEMQGGTL
jgi:RNA polymerase sigma-70 factor, ECF subfamily